MRTINQTIGYDKDFFAIIKIETDSDVLYWSNKEGGITLDGTLYDGSILVNSGEDGIADLIKDLMDTHLGGGIGQEEIFQFLISRFTNYKSLYNSFFNDWYPSSGKDYLSNRDVSIGIIWDGATLSSEITWLKKHVIDTYEYNDSVIIINTKEKSNIFGEDNFPPYKLQKNFNNLISYCQSLEDEDSEIVIPVVYGDFTVFDREISKYSLAPAVRMGQELKFKASCHFCHTIFTYVYAPLKHIKNADNVTIVRKIGGNTTVNDRRGHYYDMLGRNMVIYQDVVFQPKGLLNDTGTVNNPEFALDKDRSTYAELFPNSSISIQLGVDISENEFGQLDGDLNDCVLHVEFDIDGSQVDYEVKYYHPRMGVNSGYSSLVASGYTNSNGNKINYYFGQGNYDYGSNPKKFNDDPTWELSELQILEFHIINKSTSTAKMRITNVFFNFIDNKLYYFNSKATLTTRENTSIDRNAPRSSEKIEYKGSVGEKMYMYLKGSTYDFWI